MILDIILIFKIYQKIMILWQIHKWKVFLCLLLSSKKYKNCPKIKNTLNYHKKKVGKIFIYLIVYIFVYDFVGSKTCESNGTTREMDIWARTTHQEFINLRVSRLILWNMYYFFRFKIFFVLYFLKIVIFFSNKKWTIFF